MMKNNYQPKRVDRIKNNNIKRKRSITVSQLQKPQR